MMNTVNQTLVLASADGTAVAEEATSAAVTTETTVVVEGGSKAFSNPPTAGEIIEFQVTGLLVVFVVLGGICFLTYFMSWLLKTFVPDQSGASKKAAAPAPVAPKPAPAAAPVAPKTIHPGLSDEKLVAILTAAAHEAVGGGTMVMFRSADTMDWTWSVQGRVGLHTSHTTVA